MFEKRVTQWVQVLREGHGASERTVDSYVRCVRKLHHTVGGLLDAPELVRPRLAAWRQVEAAKVTTQKTRSAQTLRGYVAALRSFYGTLVERGWYPVDLGAEVQALPMPRYVPRPANSKQLDQLFAGAQSWRDRALLWLFYHGLRNSEVAALRTNHVRVDHGEQTIVLNVHGKGDKPRVAVLNPDGAEALARHLLEQYDSTHEIVIDPGTGTETAGTLSPYVQALDQLLGDALAGKVLPVFRSSTGRPLSRRDNNRVFADLRARAGVHGVGPHSLRHSCATDLLNAGEDLLVVKEVLGHTSVRSTERYAAVLTSTRARAVQRLRRPGKVAE